MYAYSTLLYHTHNFLYMCDVLYADSSTDSESTGGEEAKVAGSKGLGVMLVAARKKKPRKRTCLAALVDVGTLV